MITAILLNYNQKKYIKEQFLAIMRQDYKGEWELIIADDASTDGSYELLQELVNEAGQNRRIILHRNEENKGIAANLQSAVNLSRGEWIVKFDGDDIAREDHISTLVSMTEKYPGYLIFSTSCNLIDEDGNALTNEPDLDEEKIRPYKKCVFDISHVPYNHGAVSMYHRSLFTDFDELPSGRGFTDDSLLGLRAHIKKTGIVRSSKRTVYFRRGVSNIVNFARVVNKETDTRRSYFFIKTNIMMMRELFDCYAAGKITYRDFYRLMRLFDAHGRMHLLILYAKVDGFFIDKWRWFVAVLQCRPKLLRSNLHVLLPSHISKFCVKCNEFKNRLVHSKKTIK